MTDEFDRDLRAAALALIEAAPPPPPFDDLAVASPRRRPSTARRAMVAAVAVAAAALTVVALNGQDEGAPDRADTVIAAEPAVTTTTAPAPALVCGSQPPGDVWAPAGYTGPEPGPAAEADVPPGPGQLVLRWPGPSGSIELRWPRDPTLPEPPFAATPADLTGPPRLGSGAALQPRQTARGVTVRYELLALNGSVPDEACRVLQLAVYDSDPVQVEATVQWLQRSPFKPTAPLIASRQAAEAPPAIGQCRAPNPVLPRPNRQGDGEGAAFASGEAALAHFVEQNRGFVLRGYTEFALPDGTLAYGVQVGGQWVTVVHVVPTGTNQWTVSRYEATGC